MDFKSYLKITADKIEREIEGILGDFRKEVNKINPKLIPLVDAFIEACQGGKRLRGTLVKLGYELATGPVDPRNDVLKIGAAYEIFHTSILAHDDIADQSSLRRGKPTLYQALGGDHYGLSQALGLADIGFFLSAKLIADSNFSPQVKSKALSFFIQTIINTGLGQVLDVEVPHLGGERKEEDVISIHKLKTAQYTISGPLVLGAILAGAEQDLIRELGEFGENLGIAFQIQDDILGVFGDEKTLGKSVTSDIEEGKNTLLVTEALKKADAKQLRILEQYYGKGDLGDQGLKEVKKAFLETGSLDYSRQMGVKYVVKAKSIIPKITKDKIVVSILTEMADFLVEREK